MSDLLQIFVSRGGTLLGFEYFSESRVSIGSGDDADLFLEGEGVAEIHAWVERKGKRVKIETAADQPLLVNRVSVQNARLRGFDEVSVGGYSLKFKVVRSGAGASAEGEQAVADLAPSAPAGAAFLETGEFETKGSVGGAAAAGGGPPGREVTGGQEDLDASAESASLIGTTVDGRFEVRSLLGVGGMGAVYLAHQKTMGRDIALKVLKREFSNEPKVVKRFLREAQAVSKLAHPNTITVHDFGQTPEGLLYIAMEELKGTPLSTLLKDGARLSLSRALDILVNCCGALSEAHSKGVIHRDLKPDNIFLATLGGKEVVKVLDFGIAKLESSVDETRITGQGSAIGTPKYMSPEQAQNKPDLGPASDLYSLGCILFHCLAGRPPFISDSALSILVEKYTKDAPTMLEIDPSLDYPPSVHSLVADLLQRDPAQRPSSATELLARLEAIVESTESLEAEPERSPEAPPAEAPAELPELESKPAVVVTVEPMAASFWEEEEEEEEEEDLPPAFSLPGKIADELASVPEEEAPSERLGVEVYPSDGQCLGDATVVVAGASYESRLGSLVVSYPADGPPTISDGRVLKPGDVLETVVDKVPYQLRLTPLPEARPEESGPPISRKAVAVSLGSFGGHVLVLALATVLLPTQEMAEQLDVDRFARIQVRDRAVEEEKKEEKKEEEKKEEEKEEEAGDEEAPKEEPKKKKKKKKKSKGGGGPKTKKFAGGGGVLGALSRFQKVRAGKSSIAAMVSGITAVNAPSGTRAFTVAAAGEGIAGGKLVVGGRAGGAGMRTGTRGVNDIFAGGRRGKLKGKGKSKGPRGMVRKAKAKRVRTRGGGKLDKAAIAKVVNKNIGQVRYCYERTLLKQPNLRGKVILEWGIGANGRVTTVKTAVSTLNSNKLTQCIIRKVKKWKFPKPKGGKVTVSYPFVFNSVGF